MRIDTITKLPTGLMIKVEAKVNDVSNWYATGSSFGKNNSFKTTAICTYSIRSKYSINVPIDRMPMASFCALVSFLAMIVFPNNNFMELTLLGTFYAIILMSSIEFEVSIGGNGYCTCTIGEVFIG